MKPLGSGPGMSGARCGSPVILAGSPFGARAIGPSIPLNGDVTQKGYIAIGCAGLIPPETAHQAPPALVPPPSGRGAQDWWWPPPARDVHRGR
jgi:hypothetical protein